MAQDSLGNALCDLGERESDTARLKEAVTAYQAALTVQTREHVPLDWATTQDNLGNALRILGERESDTASSERGGHGLPGRPYVRTREHVPQHWATTQNNLGNALRNLGERESDTARLEEAVTAYRRLLPCGPGNASPWTGPPRSITWAMH